VTKTKRKAKTRPTEIEALAIRLETLAHQASTKAEIIGTKAMLARLASDNGASLNSLSEKLRWPPLKLREVLDPETDIDLRVLSDVATALNRRLTIAAKPATWTVSRTAT
jgi:hypothetical protein